MKHYTDDQRDFAASEDMVRKITNPRSGIYLIIILAVLILGRHLFDGDSKQEQSEQFEAEASEEILEMNDNVDDIDSRESAERPMDVEVDGVADYPAMIKVKGNLYYDSGEISEELRCGMMDGEITSMTDAEPTEDDQSNFGIGYGYQYGVDTIEVCIDHAWHVFIPYQAERNVDWDSLSEQEKMEMDPTYRGE